MSRDDVQVLAGVPEVDRAVVGRQAVQKPIIAEFEGAPALGEGWQMPRNPGSTDDRRQRSIKCSEKYWGMLCPVLVLR